MISLFKTIRRTWTRALVCVILALNQLSSFAQEQAAKEATVLHDDESVTRRIQNNARRLQRIQQSENQLRTALASIPEPSQDAVTTATEENRTLRLRLSALEKAFDAFKRTNDLGNSSIDALERQLSEAQTERDRLVKRQTERIPQTNSPTAAKGLRQETKLRGLKPIDIKLVKNRVVPGREPFFSFTRTKLKMALTGEIVDGLKITRVHDGEAAGNAVKPDGLLDILLAKADPQQSYFRLLVCADSIPAFHIVAEAVSRRGFAYSWYTSNDEDILQALGRDPDPDPTDRGYLPSNQRRQSK